MKYSIHRSLGELKTLEKRINKEISSARFIGFKKNSATKEYNTGLVSEEFQTQAKSKLDSVRDLIDRKKKFKEAIVNSNAITKVIVGTEEMTVASAIERKESIQYEKQLLQQMVTQYNQAITTVQKQNDKVENAIDEKVSVMLGGENASKNSDMVKTFGENYRKENGWDVINPLELKAIIDELDNSITTFENEVDVVLSESNATTFIEIED